MKHLLNDLSDEEKNRIREQHSGGKKIIIENFKKLIDTKLGDAKPFLNEGEDVPCKDGQYFLGEKTMSESDVLKYIKDNQEPFSGSKCMGNKKTQVTCQEENGKLNCDEARD